MLVPVESGPDGLTEYPLPRDLRLPTHFFIPWHFNRWLNSRLHLTGSYEVQGVAVALYSLAQLQAPVGTLPVDDAMLARLLRMDLVRWRDLCRADPSPLHGWRPCQSDGERRWYHPVVLEVLEDAVRRREARELSNEARARDKRIERTRAVLKELGCSEPMLADRAAMDEIETYLADTCRGRRTQAVYLRALRWANEQGIWNRGARVRSMT